MDMNKLVKAYINLRDAKIKLKREFEEEETKFNVKMQRLEAEMLRFLNENSTDSVQTPAGTVYRQEEVTPRGEDWDALYRWIAANDAFDALERRIKKTFVKEYMETNNGAIPPGVSVFREFVVRVRRKG